MIISQTIQVRINSRTFKKYKDLGYNFLHTGEMIEININDLSRYSEEVIYLKCDYCGKEFSRKYSDHFAIAKKTNSSSDCCKECRIIKSKQTVENLYQVNSVFCLSKVKAKIKETIWEKYGVNNVSQSQEIQNRIVSNNLIRYGVKTLLN